ncbi:BON domain-containing protein [Legionella brunensis]|uniref:Osmotically inducible protein Y n=1 Tax=Legionella brunensis TaxID=29422 RepID=A0A0W0S0G8_9GAMM|nr:BON domain-containing protein [Legionella brunensis]KTC76940.1 osmotically inducible protein Y [Legionella brunensis]
MDRMIQLKAAAILLSSGLACSAFAAANTDTTTTAPAAIESTPNNQPAVNTTTSVTQSNDNTLLSLVQSSLEAYKDKVQATVSNGVVYLSGQLDSDTDYEKVVILAESTQGVGDINVDKLTVKGSDEPLNDSLLTAKIKGALIQEDIMGKDLPSWSVGVETKNGQVYLSGQVASAKEKQAILDVVKSVKGVGKINDKMEVSATDNAAETNAE